MVDPCLGDGCLKIAYDLCRAPSWRVHVSATRMFYLFCVSAEVEGNVLLFGRCRKEEVEQDAIYKSMAWVTQEQELKKH